MALTPPTVAGNTTLMTSILSSLTLPDHRVTYLPQELRIDESVWLPDGSRGISGEKLGWLKTGAHPFLVPLLEELSLDKPT